MKDQEDWVMTGMDAISLFPSLSAKNTGMIVKKKVANKAKAGTTPGMQSDGLKIKMNSESKQWLFLRNKPCKTVIKELMGLVCEIAINVLWKNYCYTFGGKIRIQREGGPIGQRPTMAASRLVIMDFFKKYREILLRSDLKISLLKVYVDDGRQVTSKMRKGMRYDKTEDKFVWRKEAEEEDEQKELEGEKKDEYMARLCLPVLNMINSDLKFTAEVQSDFADNKLPTLDFWLEMKDDGKINHSYFEKPMKNQKLIEKSSAMSTKQKFCILANEVTRRLYNVEEEREDEEVTEILEKITTQLKTQGGIEKTLKKL